MSAELQVALANETLELSHMFRQNSALKHGIPDVHGAERIAKLDTTPPPPPPPINITNNIPAAPAATGSPSPGATAAAADKSSLLRRAAPWLLTLGTAGAGGLGAGYLLHSDTPAAITQPSEQSKDGSLLQYLQDKGQHLKEGAWPTK